MIEENGVVERDLKFKLPFGMVISGPSSSGKTTFLIKLLKERSELIDPPPKTVLYCYGQYHENIPFLQKMGIKVHRGPPTDEVLTSMGKPLLLVLDDLLTIIDEKLLSDLFIKKSHHQRIGVIFLTQNLFEKKIKVARINSQYIVLMSAPNSALQIRNLGVQLFPRKLKFFLDAYKDATSIPYGYLVLDLHPASNPLLRLRTNIFKGDEEKTLYINQQNE
jgi:hypothetical protein